MSSVHFLVLDHKKITYTLYFAKRKTLSIRIYPDQSIIVKAPLRTPKITIDDFVKKRTGWIVKHLGILAEKESLQIQTNTPHEKRYPYLDEAYHLQISSDLKNSIRLQEKSLIITCAGSPSHEKISMILDEWYRRQANIYFYEVFEQHWPRFREKGYKKPTLKVKSLRSRWGSLSSKGVLTLNIELIKTPRECIEYVMVHELCHLIHFNHSLLFWQEVERILPTYKKCRQWLKNKAI